MRDRLSTCLSRCAAPSRAVLAALALAAGLFSPPAMPAAAQSVPGAAFAVPRAAWFSGPVGLSRFFTCHYTTTCFRGVVETGRRRDTGALTLRGWLSASDPTGPTFRGPVSSPWELWVSSCTPDGGGFCPGAVVDTWPNVANGPWFFAHDLTPDEANGVDLAAGWFPITHLQFWFLVEARDDAMPGGYGGSLEIGHINPVTTVTPEPTPLALLAGAGLLGTLLVRRRAASRGA